MKVKVQLFAAARERAGVDVAELELPDGATVADLRRGLVAKYSGLDAIAQHLLIAIGDDYATDNEVVTEGSRLAAFPPVSGG